MNAVLRNNSTEPRFVACWITKEGCDESGDFDPDRTEYGYSAHTTLEAAQRAATAGGKKANVTDWVRVHEEIFQPDLGIPARSPAAWDTSRVWHGDWDGNWEEDRW